MFTAPSAPTLADDVREILGADLDLAGVAHIEVLNPDGTPFLRSIAGLSEGTRARLMALLDEEAPEIAYIANVDVYGPNGQIESRRVPLDHEQVARVVDLAHQRETIP